MSGEKTLSGKVQVLLLESLCGSFNIFEPRTVVNHNQEKAELLTFLVAHNDISRFMVESAVRTRLLVLGNEMFQSHLKTRAFPDPLWSEDVFGYYLKNNVQFIPSVRFDHDETADEYIKFAEGLVASVVDQLLNYKKPEPVVLNIDDVCCCH